MKKYTLLLALTTLLCFKANSQITCVFCYDQNDSISDNVTNYIVNGGFETSTCPTGWGGYFCPTSSSYSCDITGWTCTGGGPSTYASRVDASFSVVVEGVSAAYLGNFYCNPCSGTVDDLSCISFSDSCAVLGIPVGYPDAIYGGYGGSTGVSIQQTVPGLVPGNIYALEFWSGGESGGGYFSQDGVFGVDVGFGYLMLSNNPTNGGSTDIGIRYIVEFIATSTSHTIKFTNWGHICSTCTEAILDDIRLYPIEDLDPSVPVCDPTFLFVNASQVPISCNGANDGIAFVTVTSGNPPYTYSWSPGGSINDTITGLGPGTYTVTLIDSLGTVFVDSVTITQPNVLTVDVTTLNDSVCAGTSVTLNSAANGGTTAYNYQWTTNANDTLANNTETPVSSGYIGVTVTDANGCTTEDSLYITVLTVPNIVSSPDSCICSGASITLTAAGTPGYNWSTGQTTASITVSPLVNTTYIVSYTNGICSDDDSTFICVNPTPLVIASNDTLIEYAEPANPVNLFSTGTGTIVWTPSNSLSCSACANPIATPGETTTYTVVVTNAFGCTGTDQITVTIFYSLLIPNIFTPNADGMNDVFNIQGLPPGSSLKIFNRWGNEMYSTDAYNNQWTISSDGVYYYILTTPDDKSYSGFFHVTGNK